MRRQGRAFYRFGMTMWAIAVAAWVAYLGREAAVTTCEFAPGTSVFGDAEWTWLPPGVTCTYDESDVRVGRHVDSPPLDRLGIALVFLLWPVALASARAEATAGDGSREDSAR